jgi:hypothetical protein
MMTWQKIQVRGPKARYAYVQKFRVITPSNYWHDQTTFLNSYFDQDVSIRSSLLDYQEMEVFESQRSEIFYEHHVYDEYLDSEDHIYFSICIESHNSPPLFDDYDESDLEISKQQIIAFSSEGVVQLETNQQHHKINQSMYDSGEVDSWTDNEEDKEDLLKELILSSSSTVKQHIQEINEPKCDILEPEKEKTNNGAKKLFHFKL